MARAQEFLSLEFEGLDALEQRLTKAGLLLTHPNADEIGKIVERYIAAEAPQGRTGKLAAGIRFRVQPLEGGFILELVSDAFYLKWILNGRGWVYPVRAKALRWETATGQVVYAKSARPTKPNPFPQRGWAKAQPVIYQKWQEAGLKVASVLAG